MRRFLLTAIALCAVFSSNGYADNFTVDKVYHPYVLPFEREFEWRLTSRQNDDGNVLMQRFSFGHALSEFMILETYLVGARDENQDFGLESYEVELRWMMTEQGRYWADWATLFELEKQHNTDDWAVKAGILTEKEFGQFSLTTNISLVYEWGQTVENEWESEFKAKFRYRWIPEVQPGVEVYVAEDFIGVGPAFMGIKRYDRQKQLKWELGFIAGLNGDSKDHTLRMSLEYEF
ncbi:hypothetical protein [Alteromonas mediterranea]|uniref:Uncharacterized protein n=2 Tax=Alteromonas mediterranea TaxID=314275 RepID=S5A9N1_9ALTE|nr:hypothetical protein [Alteromonas mediterranea]AGP77047.1 hypothetical protein I633_03890 [Alteromonas mediterranea 615]MEA3380120.1 hypothetical protein [Pseudomonadota bacterium]AFV84289.1 hypothetical protein amad1_03815 [Alteromonas mediterranea DE1]AGP96297.1 hypothetical protein I635_03780 [Alteromonas mediterranea UM7]AGQ00631.1 hypothetical protein I636_03805 [Alteromonas mediterranea UM4b]